MLLSVLLRNHACAFQKVPGKIAYVSKAVLTKHLVLTYYFHIACKITFQLYIMRLSAEQKGISVCMNQYAAVNRWILQILNLLQNSVLWWRIYCDNDIFLLLNRYYKLEMRQTLHLSNTEKRLINLNKIQWTFSKHLHKYFKNLILIRNFSKIKNSFWNKIKI